ncbi:unnamed protein product, partial [marine sediment metagenome]
EKTFSFRNQVGSIIIPILPGQENQSREKRD